VEHPWIRYNSSSRILTPDSSPRAMTTEAAAEELGPTRPPKVNGSIKYGLNGEHTYNPSNLGPIKDPNPANTEDMDITKATSTSQEEGESQE